MSEVIDYNKRAHDWIMAKGEATIKENPLPKFSTDKTYRFNWEPKATFKFVKSTVLTNPWGNLPLHHFERQDGQVAVITKYSEAPEVI